MHAVYTGLITKSGEILPVKYSKMLNLVITLEKSEVMNMIMGGS